MYGAWNRHKEHDPRTFDQSWGLWSNVLGSCSLCLVCFMHHMNVYIVWYYLMYTHDCGSSSMVTFWTLLISSFVSNNLHILENFCLSFLTKNMKHSLSKLPLKWPTSDARTTKSSMYWTTRSCTNWTASGLGGQESPKPNCEMNFVKRWFWFDISKKIVDISLPSSPLYHCEIHLSRQRHRSSSSWSQVISTLEFVVKFNFIDEGDVCRICIWWSFSSDDNLSFDLFDFISFHFIFFFFCDIEFQDSLIRKIIFKKK